jgi:phosphohistidine phosphatase
VIAVRDHLADSDTLPALVLCSSAARTVETLDGIRATLPEETTVEIEPGLYGADVDELVQRLRRVPPTVPDVMLIGHNPGIEDLALLLTGEPVSKFPTAALARLRIDDEWTALQQGVAHLEEFWTPR